MRVLPTLAIAIVALAGARFARVSASTTSASSGAPTVPFTPSPANAPFVALGYREAAADLLYVRMIGYFCGDDSTGSGVADLAEAIGALDPEFQRVYEYGANAMTLAKFGVDNEIYLRAVALLEAGTHRFPQNWQLPYLAGQIYSQDLKTDDPNQRRAWDERAIMLIESAIRKPGAPTRAASWATMMRTKLGQHERAVANLREMVLITSDARERQRLLDLIGQLQIKDAAVMANEIDEVRRVFDRRWRQERPAVNATMYVLIGTRLQPGFDMVDLATGGRDLYVPTVEPLEPLE